MSTPRLTAKCLCQRVSIEMTPKSNEIGVCHCNTCRQWSGGPYLGIESDQVKLAGTITCYDSSEWAQRGFCQYCGTHLFYRLKDSDTHFMPIGLFEEPPAMVMSHQIFIDSKPPYYNFAEKTQCMTGEEVFARYTGDSQ